MSPPPAIHATAVVVGEAGVLIRGASGAGKSALALALVVAAGRAGLFGCLVGDDRVRLVARHGRLVAAGHPAVAGLIERRGQGLENMACEASAVVRLIVDLVEPAAAPRLPTAAERREMLAGVETARMALASNGSARDQAEAVLARLRAEGG